MRPSPQRHTLAVLRLVVGLTQKEMADILDCSTPTIQSIELGKLNLSERLAGLASLKTGINLSWLLNNDLNKLPIDIEGAPYSKELFEDYQAIGHLQKHSALGSLQALHSLTMNFRRLCSLTLRAYKMDDSALCAYKLAKMFDNLDKHFGVSEEDHEAVKTPKTKAAAGEGDKSPKSEMRYALEGFFTSMRLEINKKKKANKIPFPAYKEHVWTDDGQIHYIPERRIKKNLSSSTPKQKKK
jgi:DNA-binding XRE family transcriptional regulator